MIGLPSFKNSLRITKKISKKRMLSNNNIYKAEYPRIINK